MSIIETLGVFTFNEANIHYNGCAFTVDEIQGLPIPDILFVGTQESIDKGSFHEAINCWVDKYYCLVARNNLKLPFGATVINVLKTVKNVRGSLYILRTKILKQTCLAINSPSFKLKNGSTLNISQRIESLKGSSSKKTIQKKFKSVVVFRLECVLEEKLVLAPINLLVTHLYFTAGQSQGFLERVFDLEEIIKNFYLVQAYNRGETVILCGDLNFRMNPYLQECESKLSKLSIDRWWEEDEKVNWWQKPKISRPISWSQDKKEIDLCAQYVIDLYRNRKKQELERIFELYPIITNPSDIKTYLGIAAQDISFVKSLMSSLYLDYPTCRYKKNHRTIYTDQDLDNKDFGWITKGKPRIPSSCDQILFTNKNANSLVLLSITPWSAKSMVGSDHVALLALFRVK